ncbi:hypothetical protein PAMP_015486 [Pampus punctatissimus]
MEGETVNITCCWRGKFKRVRVTWLANQTKIENEIRIINNTTVQKEDQCSTLVFTNITRNDSGIYFCKVTVEIPKVMDDKGNGTVIKVMDGDHMKDTTGAKSASPMNIILAVGTPVLLLGLVCVCTLKRRRERTARVIYEAPHTNSEEADMDKDSTQWCQVLVYESIDYFEHTERKQSE